MAASIRINEKILSIPPYLSTSWSYISAIQMKGEILAISLIDGESVYIPSLKKEHIELVFQFHAEYLEKELALPLSKGEMSNLQHLAEEQATVRFSIGTPLEGFGMVMNHNPDQADAPDLPVEILDKISSITKIIGPPDEALLPQAEQNCNCFHCQIARVVNKTSFDSPLSETVELHEEDIKNEELEFQQWDIAPVVDNDKLYDVVNKLDPLEKYHVFLGDPVGCTCGKSGCEHILAVLKS